jgi:5'(3')-deoxyribonucleotidase
MLTAMFCIEVINPDQSDDDDGEIEYMSIELMRIDVAGIENHIRDQGLAAGKFFDALNVADQNAVIKEIALYAIMLVTSLTGVKAECDENNQPLDHDAPPVMPQQLVTLCPAKFIQKVLNKYRDHLQKF